MASKKQSVTSQIIEKAASAAELFAARPEIKARINAIEHAAEDRHDQMIKAAEEMVALRAAFEPNRKAIGMTWQEWGRAHIKNGNKDRLALLARIAEAPTIEQKQAIIRVHRRGQNERQAESLANKKKREEEAKAKAEEKAKKKRMAKARKHLIEWAETAPTIEVQRIWSRVQTVFLPHKVRR